MKSSVTTKHGDRGETDALSGDRLPKTHPIIECTGCLDELRAHTALVRQLLPTEPAPERQTFADITSVPGTESGGPPDESTLVYAQWTQAPWNNNTIAFNNTQFQLDIPTGTLGGTYRTDINFTVTHYH